MKLKITKEKWQKRLLLNSKDDYSNAVTQYAISWAKLMEKAIDNGEKLADVAEQLSYDADTSGITGFMYGCAVKELCNAWKYGEELRQWHNINTQINKEGEKANKNGGVLNPAVLTIGSKQ